MALLAKEHSEQKEDDNHDGHRLPSLPPQVFLPSVPTIAPRPVPSLPPLPTIAPKPTLPPLPKPRVTSPATPLAEPFTDMFTSTLPDIPDPAFQESIAQLLPLPTQQATGRGTAKHVVVHDDEKMTSEASGMELVPIDSVAKRTTPSRRTSIPSPEPTPRSLTVHQVRKCQEIMGDVYDVEVTDGSVGSIPHLKVCLVDFLCFLYKEIDKDTEIKWASSTGGIQLIGGATQCVLLEAYKAPDIHGVSRHTVGNDVDLVIKIDFDIFQYSQIFDRLRDMLITTLQKFVPDFVRPEIMTTRSMAAAYIDKLVKIPPSSMQVTQGTDCWFLVCFRCKDGPNLEFKFIHTMARDYQFSIDSFHILLTHPFLEWVKLQKQHPHGTISQALRKRWAQFQVQSDLKSDEGQPNTVVNDQSPSSGLVFKNGNSWPQLYAVCSGPHLFHDSLADLIFKNIYALYPESCRGGCFLKFCDLMNQEYQWHSQYKMEDRHRMQDSMIIRFTIDHPTAEDVRVALNRYIVTHYSKERKHTLFGFLQAIKMTVERSSSVNKAPILVTVQEIKDSLPPSLPFRGRGARGRHMHSQMSRRDPRDYRYRSNNRRSGAPGAQPVAKPITPSESHDTKKKEDQT